MAKELIAGKMFRPSDLEVDIIGQRIYVVEKFNHRISKWDFTSGLFDFKLDAGQLTSVTVTDGGTGYNVGDPVDVSAPTLNIANPVNATAEVATETGNVIDTILVTESGNGYDPNNLPTVTATTGGSGAILAAVLSTPWGSNGDGTSGEPGPVVSTTDNFFDNPTGVTFDVIAQRLFITDTHHHRVKVMDADDGSIITSVGQGGRGNGDFYFPAHIAINDSCSFFVVADEFNHRAVKYNTAATPAFQSVLTSPTPKPFNHPHGVSYDQTEDEFMVADEVTGVISVYDLDATTFTTQIGTPRTTGSDGLFFPSSGHGTSAATSLFFANTRSNQIKSKTGATTLANELTDPGTGDGQLYWPESCEVFTSTADYLIIANTLNNRVEAFDQTLTFQTSFGSP